MAASGAARARWQKARRSTIALKATMAASGLVMIGYLVAHMLGNLKVFAGHASFDEYAHHLRTIGEPMLPHEGLLWIIRVVLLASIVLHIWSATVLTIRARRATGGSTRYRSKSGRKDVQRTYAAATMRMGGVLVLLFVVYHLLHLTANSIAPGGASESPYQRVVNGFEIWWVVVIYTISMIAVCLHIRHGLWSAGATLGFNKSEHRQRTLNRIAIAVAAVLLVGFLLPPWSILLGVI